jgi:NitT/TauT family transport system permease protein
VWLAVAAPALLAATWCLLSYGGVVSPMFLPSPTDVVRGLLQLTFDKGLAEAVLTSTRRISISFVLASMAALPLGVAMGSFEPVRWFFEPVMAPLRFMPISAFIPLLILWFGIQEGQKIAFLFLGVFVYLLPVVVNAIRAVPQEYVDTAYTLGANRWQVIRTVLLPAALPEIVDSFRVMNAIAWTYVILAEAVNPGTSLGYLIQLAYTHSKPQWSFAGLVVIGGVGLLTDALLRGLSAMLFQWREAR